MNKEPYQKISYYCLRDCNGVFIARVPLYLKIADLDLNGIAYTQEETIHRITERMLRHYEREISDFFAQKQKGVIL